jgi:hypothetical protein
MHEVLGWKTSISLRRRHLDAIREVAPGCVVWFHPAVEEKERSTAMKPAQTIQCFDEGQDLWSERFPVLRARASSFRVNSMLCSTSLARSSVHADDRLPVPVFDKSGSGLKR